MAFHAPFQLLNEKSRQNVAESERQVYDDAGLTFTDIFPYELLEPGTAQPKNWKNCCW